MVRARADLHTHSAASDGSDTPTELVRAADEMQLGGIGLTDHDSLDGIREFMDATASDDLRRVPGVEISTEFNSAEAHILGYFVPHDSKQLNDRLEHLRKGRHDRLPKMIQKLNDLGIDVSIEELYKELEGVSSPGRPHVALLLVKKGVVKSTREAFDKYIAFDRPAFVKKVRMQTFDAVRLLKTIRAIPVLAHPLTIKTHDLRTLIEDLMTVGLLGVEVDYDYRFMGTHRTPDEVSEVIKGLEVIQTGGSDYHGAIHYTELGSITVPVEVIDELEKIRSEFT
ncbi:MAG: PHP domain-containing protein [Candidatus Thorarchaeota archaeon]